MATNAAVAAAPTADAEGRPAQPDPGGLRLAEAPTPLMNVLRRKQPFAFFWIFLSEGVMSG